MSTVAVYDEFLLAFARLPRKEQRQARDFARRAIDETPAAGDSLETVQGARDPNVRTVRIGKDHRAVLLRSDADNASVMLWIDRHDAADEWARNRTFSIHPATGALQVFDMERLTSYLRPLRAAEATELTGSPAALPQLSRDESADAADESARARKRPATATAAAPPFADTPESVLLAAGVPPVLVPAVRAIRDRAHLAELGRHLAAETLEALMRTLRGDEPLPPPGPASRAAGSGPFEGALDHPDSRRRFAVLRSPDDLESILEAPLARWRLFLHPSQERLAHGRFSGPVRILGGAGTGKTVVAMHRARFLAREVFAAPGDRILFTTFTANLAQNLRELLAGFCGPELARIDVVNLHAWALHHARAAGLQTNVADDVEMRAAWERAIREAAPKRARDRSFYEAEWRHLMQSGESRERDAYVEADRPARSPRLPREERAEVWPVLDRFRGLLDEAGKLDWSDLMRSVRIHAAARSGPPLYRAAVVDETQDLGAEELMLVRALVPQGPDDLFLVGDAHQRIYGPKLVLSRLGIESRGRSFRLRLNYRTTEQIRDWAAGLLANCSVDDLEGDVDGHSGYVSLMQGVLPEVRHLPTEEHERRLLTELLSSLVHERPLESICVVARTRGALETLVEPALKRARLPYVFLEKQSDRDAGPGIRLATMHRVKGLEFTCVIVAGVTAGNVPLIPPWIARLDAEARAEHELRERSILYVAATRAREQLILTAGGPLSPFLTLDGFRPA